MKPPRRNRKKKMLRPKYHAGWLAEELASVEPDRSGAVVLGCEFVDQVAWELEVQMSRPWMAGMSAHRN